MSVQVTVNGNTHNLPTQGTTPPWGEDLSDLLLDMIEVLNSVVGTNDITTTSFTLTNNQAVAANITGAAFDATQVRSAIMNYSVSITTSLNEFTEAGFLILTYRSGTSSWDLVNYSGGSNSGVTFTINSSGQLMYTTTNVAGTGYSGKLKFTAKSFLQT